MPPVDELAASIASLLRMEEAQVQQLLQLKRLTAILLAVQLTIAIGLLSAGAAMGTPTPTSTTAALTTGLFVTGGAWRVTARLHASSAAHYAKMRASWNRLLGQPDAAQGEQEAQ